MFDPNDILYEDNHLLVVNKHAGDLVQPDPSGESALEDQIKAFIKRRDAKPGAVFLGVVHRIDRPVSGAVLFAKTSKALVRLNEMIREGRIRKTYWALTERTPDPESGELLHYILRDGRTNRSQAFDAPKGDAKQARLRYATLGVGTRHARRGRAHHGPPPPDSGAVVEDRLPDPRRSEVRREAVAARRRHFAPFAPRGVRTPRAPQPGVGHGPVPAGDNLWAHFENP